MLKDPFGDALVGYLRKTKWPGASVGEQKINLDTIRRCDFRSAHGTLICSVPGRHTGAEYNSYGHRALRQALMNENFEERFKSADLVCQFTSIGSLKGTLITLSISGTPNPNLLPYP